MSKQHLRSYEEGAQKLEIEPVTSGLQGQWFIHYTTLQHVCVCIQIRVRKQPIIALYFEFETVLTVYNLGAWPLDKSVVSKIIFSYFSTETYVVGTQKNLLNEMVLLSTQNIC